MPQIPQHYLDCSIYLYDSKDAAEAGENFGGSGCLVSVYSHPIYDPPLVGDPRIRRKLVVNFPAHIYAVTNKHVVEDGGCPVIRLNTVDDKIDVLELEQDDWVPHPDGDDLVVAPIGLPKGKHNYQAIPSDSFVTRDSLTYSFDDAPIGAGDDTFMVGRFISHAGTQRNTPSLRFGSIAMLPFEKIRLASGHMQEAFLVETRSISGYSGSPVFVYRPITQTTVIPGQPYGYQSDEIHTTSLKSLVGKPKLLGIDCGHVLNYDQVIDGAKREHPYGWQVASNTGMAIVIPAWRLNDLLNQPELVMQRKKKNEEYLEQKEAEKRESSVAFDVGKKPQDITEDSYMDALRRASRKVSQPEPEKSEE